MTLARQWLIAATSCLVTTGCGPQAEYQVAMNAPWCDEYTVPTRPTGDATLLLPQPIVQWHARLDPQSLNSEARAKADGRGAVYVYTRRTLATRTGGGAGPERIWIVEARLGKRYLPRGNPGWSGPSGTMPLGAAASAFSRELGVPIKLSGFVDANMSVSAPGGMRDPRDSFVRVLVEKDLFVSEWEFLPLTVHSYEYASKSAFLDAVAAVADELQSRPTPASITVVPASIWYAAASKAQEDVIESLTKRLQGDGLAGKFHTTVALPSPTMLSDDERIALRQAAFAMAAQVAPGSEATH